MCAVAPLNVTVVSRASPSLIAVLDPSEGGTGGGNRNSGAPFPGSKGRSRWTVTCVIARWRKCATLMFLPVCELGGHNPAAFCAAGVAVRGCRSRGERQWGVSDPHLAAPFFAPRPALRGSLTPHMHVTIVRRDGAMPVTPAECGACVERGAHVVRVNCARASVRFFRETAFIWVNAHFRRIAARDSTRAVTADCLG
jgi:hypothetical protein